MKFEGREVVYLSAFSIRGICWKPFLWKFLKSSYDSVGIKSGLPPDSTPYSVSGNNPFSDSLPKISSGEEKAPFISL